MLPLFLSTAALLLLLGAATGIEPKPPVSPTPEYEWCKALPVTATTDGHGKKVFTKRCPNQTAHQSPKGEPSSALLWTFKNIAVTIYEDVPFVRMTFTPEMKWGFGGEYYLIVTLFRKDGMVRDRLVLFRDGNEKQLSSFPFEYKPSCGDHDKQLRWEKRITPEQFNDIANFSWGWKIVEPKGSKWKQCPKA